MDQSTGSSLVNAGIDVPVKVEESRGDYSNHEDGGGDNAAVDEFYEYPQDITAFKEEWVCSEASDSVGTSGQDKRKLDDEMASDSVGRSSKRIRNLFRKKTSHLVERGQMKTDEETAGRSLSFSAYEELLRKGYIKYKCLWRNCEEAFNKEYKLEDHVMEHIPEDNMRNGNPAKCKWKYRTKNVNDLKAHVFAHVYHEILMTYGAVTSHNLGGKATCTEGNVEECHKESVGYLEDLWLDCRWTDCQDKKEPDFVLPDILSFRRHVKNHLINYLQDVKANQDEKVDCLWETEKGKCTFKSSKRLTVLIEHVESHIKVKSIACPYCGVLYANHGNLINHLTPFLPHSESLKCNECGALFPTKSKLRSHQSTHNKKFPSKSCKAVCSRLPELVDHYISRHTEKRCPFCNEQLPNRNICRGHVKYHAKQQWIEACQSSMEPTENGECLDNALLEDVCDSEHRDTTPDVCKISSVPSMYNLKKEVSTEMEDNAAIDEFYEYQQDNKVFKKEWVYSEANDSAEINRQDKRKLDEEFACDIVGMSRKRMKKLPVAQTSSLVEFGRRPKIKAGEGKANSSHGTTPFATYKDLLKCGTIKFKCLWSNCKFAFNKDYELEDHVLVHMPELDETAKEQSLCEWKYCYNITTFDMMRHMYAHVYHEILMIYGATISYNLDGKAKCTEVNIVECRRNSVRFLEDLLLECRWTDCQEAQDPNFVLPDILSFRRHVKNHLIDYLQDSKRNVKPNQDGKVDCLWETCAFKSSRLMGPLIEHVESHTKVKSVACPKCGVLYANHGNLINHLTPFLPDSESLKCNECSALFPTKSKLRSHQSTHEKKFQCKTCRHLCSRLQELVEHYVIHHTERKCPFCDNELTNRKFIRAHISSHGREKWMEACQSSMEPTENGECLDSALLEDVRDTEHQDTKPDVCKISSVHSLHNSKKAVSTETEDNRDNQMPQMPIPFANIYVAESAEAFYSETKYAIPFSQTNRQQLLDESFMLNQNEFIIPDLIIPDNS